MRIMNITEYNFLRLWDTYSRITRKDRNISGAEGLKNDIDKLFDISKPDVQAHINAEDFAFLQDQRGARKATFGAKDLASIQKSKRKRSAEEAEIHRKEKCLKEVTETSSQLAFTSSEEGTSSTSGSDDSDIITLTESATTSKRKYVTLNVPRHVTSLPQVVEAADRHKLSNNAVNDILAALIRDCGCDLNDFVLSKSTTLRMRQVALSSRFDDVKRYFKADVLGQLCTVHWDEKLLKEGNDFKAKEHIAKHISFEGALDIFKPA